MFLSLNSFWWPKSVVPRFWGCKPEIPEYGIEGELTTNSGNRFLKLSLGVGSQKSRVSYFGTNIIRLSKLFPRNFFIGEIMTIK